MSRKIYYGWFTAVGWRKQMLDSEAAFEIDLENRVLYAIPQFSKTEATFTVSDHGSVWFEDWAHAKHRIFPTFPLVNCSLLRRRNSRFKVDGPGSVEFISEITQELRKWAEGIDKTTEILSHAQDRERYGLMSFDHITALAMLGRTSDIEAWRRSVEAGDEPRLHPRIFLDCLDRAIELSKEMPTNNAQ